MLVAWGVGCVVVGALLLCVSMVLLAVWLKGRSGGRSTTTSSAPLLEGKGTSTSSSVLLPTFAALSAFAGAALLISAVLLGSSSSALGSAPSLARATSTGDSEGRIRFFNTLGPSMETDVSAIKSNNSATVNFANTHWAGSLAYSSHFDSGTRMYPNRAVAYLDVYAIYVDAEPAGWEQMVLKSSTGTKLMIPWDCPSSQGRYCQWAGDFSSPTFRQWIIGKAHTILDGNKWAGLFLDDMNLAWPPRTADAQGMS